MANYIYYLCFLVLAGCATLESSLERRQETFEITTFNYEKAIRWGHYELAYDSVKVNDTDQKKPDFDKLRDVRVSSYEVLNRTISEGELQAQQTVEIKYYNVNSLIEKTLVHKELWEFDRDKKTWYLRSGFPELK